MRILITSDNHLGYKEKDFIRRDDSFNTFEEILRLARRESVDLLLQGGDLFDENTPSRNTYNRTIQLLREYCVGEPAPSTLVTTPKLNAHDNYVNIRLPVLTIHGNHDDPGGLNRVSPHDILQSSGLVNYFGKQESSEQIEIKPILIEGDCKVALYGLGYMKDRPLYRAFAEGRVSYQRPPGDSDWYCILAVHQNRVPRENEYLPEDLIDPFFDLVVYGHEHESLRLKHRNFEVIQCGSTVRTSLVEGEAHDKYVYILELGQDAAIRRIALTTVRPFIMESIKIDTGNVDEIVEKKLNQMIRRAYYTESTEQIPDVPAGEMPLPLVRLRVELGERLTFNKHRITEFLRGRTANEDVLRISKKTKKRGIGVRQTVTRVGIEDIYLEKLQQSTLSVLTVPRVLDALREFVHKDNKNSWNSLVQEGVRRIIGSMDMENPTLEDITSSIRLARESVLRSERGQQMQPEAEEYTVADDTADLFCASPFGVSLLDEMAADGRSCSQSDNLPDKPQRRVQKMHRRVEDGDGRNCEDEGIRREFTFLEDLREQNEGLEIVKDCLGESDDESRNQNKRPKYKETDDESDLINFSAYL